MALEDYLEKKEHLRTAGCESEGCSGSGYAFFVEDEENTILCEYHYQSELCEGGKVETAEEVYRVDD